MKLKPIITILLTALVPLSCCACGSGESSAVQPTTQAVTTSPATTALSSPDEPTTAPKTEPVATEPAKANSAAFTELINQSGIDGELGCSQLVIVKSDDTSASVSCFEQIGGAWQEVEGLTEIEGYVGSMGVSYDASEYATYTPAGLFRLGTAFGINDDPGTAMEYFKVTEDSYWVDDPDSEFYNRHVEGTEDADWNSAEHLIDHSVSYRYAVFITYNSDPAVPGLGSAFFLHVGYEPTAGCVAIPEEKMVAVLKWLNPESNPKIMIF